MNSMNTSPGKQSGADRYNQLTKLNEDEENVDFMNMFEQYHNSAAAKIENQQQMEEEQHILNQQEQAYTNDQYQQMQQPNGAQVQYYQANQNQNESYSERQNEIYQNNAQLGAQYVGPGGIPRPEGKQTRSLRPGSATVAAQAGRFINNQQGKRRNGQNGSQNQLDHYSYSFQQPAPNINNLMGNSANTGSSHRPSQFQLNQRPPLAGRKKTRPQSAAKNQMNPSKELQSVTNFTYQKAIQNLNQRAYVPDSLKNTDKERLYEEKINLKKMLNEQLRQNQQLKTQIQSQQGLIRKKDDMVQQVMKQMFNPQSQSNSNLDSFLQDFQQREILHNKPLTSNQKPPAPKMKISKSTKNQNVLVNKDSQITSIKLKMKETYEILQQKEKELFDLKQTLKFTKIKEYEAELALNVQESQRLRVLLEREIQKPKIDPRFVQGLKQQIGQYQQMIQNLQSNQSLQQENNEKLNKKLINFVKKFSKQKEARKRLLEKNQRLEKKLVILQSRPANPQPPLSSIGKRGSQAKQNNDESKELEWNKRFNDQANLIEKLLIKMQNCGVEINEEELIEMQLGDEDQQLEEGDQFNQQQVQDPNTETWDMVVVYGGALGEDGLKNKTVQKEINGAEFQNLNDLNQQMRSQFEISDSDEIKIKYVNQKGQLNDLVEDLWDHIKELAVTNQIQLGIELIKPQIEEESNYEEDNDFEEVVSEKVYLNPVTEKDVQSYFKELKLILQIKNIKKGDLLKFILHGIRDSDTNKKSKIISIQTLSEQIESKIGFNNKASVKMAKFLIEKPNEDGKIEQLGPQEQNHFKQSTISRKELQAKLLDLINDYILYNGMALTSLLTRVQGIFEEQRIELEEELNDRDYEETGTSSLPEIIETMRLIGLSPKNFDLEVTEFIEYLAMRHAKSLEEVPYKDLLKCFEEDYNFIDDKKSIWEKDGNAYEPSSDEGELESEKSPEKSVHEADDAELENKQEDENKSENIDDLEQNVLLEKVDEILMQIVQKLPQQNKIRTLTQYMMPFLSQVYDQELQRQYLIINQNAFIQFLLGQGNNQLGLQLEESHIVCLLHLLVQEDEKEEEQEQDQEQDSQSKYILYDEFIELVKTYMKKELIMNQSKGLGINYDILSKQSVEFLFQIRSSLMHDTNINENSADEDEIYNNKKNKSVPTHIREIFHSIIEKKNIQLKTKENGSQVEVMDFDMMLDILFMRMGINCPSTKSQEELKYLMCLDFKYLEMVMLVKFDKVMHDLDYISIDLLRQAQDPNMNQKRTQTLNQLKSLRDQQLSVLKNMQEQSAIKKNAKKPKKVVDIYANGTESYEYNGVSQSSKQEKKRKRPDDKKQTISKKLGSSNNNQFVNQKDSQQIEQDQYGASSSGVSPGNGRYGIKQDHYAGNIQTNTSHKGQDHFDDIDVDLDVDINNSDKLKGQSRHDKISDEPSDQEEDYLQDDIPIDEDDDEDGIISDNYDNFDKTQPEIKNLSPPSQSNPINDTKNGSLPTDDNIISMEHSDDLEGSQKPGYVLPNGRSNRSDQLDDINDDEDDIEDQEDEEDQLEDQYEDDDDMGMNSDMDEIEGMNREELEQAMLVAGLMQDMAGDDEDDESPQQMSSDRGQSIQEHDVSDKLANSMPDDQYEDDLPEDRYDDDMPEDRYDDDVQDDQFEELGDSMPKSSPQQALPDPIHSQSQSHKSSQRSRVIESQRSKAALESGRSIQESLRSKQQESARSIQQESIRSINQKSIRSIHQESAKSIKQESVRSIKQQESVSSIKQQSVRSIKQQESVRSIKQESARSIKQQESARSIKQESVKSKLLDSRRSKPLESGRSQAQQSNIDNYSVDLEDKQSNQSKGNYKSLQQSSHNSSHRNVDTSRQQIQKPTTSRKSLKSSIQSFKELDNKSFKSMKSIISSMRSIKADPISEVQEPTVQTDEPKENYKDKSQNSSKQSKTMSKLEQIKAYDKKSSHSIVKDGSVQSGTVSQKMSLRVSAKVSQRYQVSEPSAFNRNSTEEQDIIQRRSMDERKSSKHSIQKSMNKSVDKQERSPDQQQELESEVEDFDIQVPSVKQSTKSFKVQDEVSDKYDDFDSSHHSQIQSNMQGGIGDLMPKTKQSMSGKVILDEQKSSVQQFEEDNYIQDNSGSDDYEDDFGAVARKSASKSESYSEDIQQDDASSIQNSGLMVPQKKGLIKTDSNQKMIIKDKIEAKESEGSDYEF